MLEGRCYEQEWVPFKAVDSLIDALARHLKQRSKADLERLLPADAFLLARVFPVLRGVPGVLQTRPHHAELPDPQELRLRVFAALRDLLMRLSNETRLVLMIDDLQWGDVDSAVLLADLLCNPDPPHLLFIGSFRAEDAERSRFLQTLRQSCMKADSGPHHRELAVEELSQAESRDLAMALLGRQDLAARAQAHLVARESQGNPLFINELVRFIQSGALSEGWDAASRNRPRGGALVPDPGAARGCAATAGNRRGIRTADLSSRWLFARRNWEQGVARPWVRLRSARLIRSTGPDRTGSDRDLS